MFSSSHTISRKSSIPVRAGVRRLSSRVGFSREAGLCRALAFYPFPHFCMEATTVATKANKPLKVFRLEDVAVSVFANVRAIDGERVTFYNVAMSKTYKKGGETRRTQSFGSNDIAKLIQLLKEAGEFVDSVKNRRAEILPKD